MGANFSSKLSPWMANGSISAKYIYHQVKQFEEKKGHNESTKHFIDELFWRDFFHFYCLKAGTSIFFPYGSQNRSHNGWKRDADIITRWK